MSKSEKRIIRLAIILVLMAFFLNAYFSNAVAEAGPTQESRPPAFRWDEDGAEDIIWEVLHRELTEQATAAVMGNLDHESGCCPFRYEGLDYEQSYKLNNRLKTSEEAFVYEERGYGIASWYGAYNKQKLWDFCEANGYEVDDAEAQAEFLLEDLKNGEPMCFKRLNLYTLEQMMFAVEDFRQSYEKCEWSEYTQYKRGKLARHMFAEYCEDIYDIPVMSSQPYNFDIYNTVKQLNERILKDEQDG